MIVSHWVGILSLAVAAMLAGTVISSGSALAQLSGAAHRFTPTETAPLIRVELKASRPLTAQQLRDLEAKPDQWNMKARLPPDFTSGIGLTSGTQTITVRQLGRKTSAGYAVAINRISNSTDMILIVRDPAGATNVFLLAEDFSVKKTARLQQGQPAAEIPEAEAQRLLDGALTFFAQLAATFAASQ